VDLFGLISLNWVDDKSITFGDAQSIGIENLSAVECGFNINGFSFKLATLL
jgi:hypothetical protein